MAAHTGVGRDALLAAAYQQIARLGYSGATTAKICAAAGVGSGTFFHFFPAKVDVVAALLEQAVADADERRASLVETAAAEPRAALRRWAEQIAADAADPDFAGFVTAVGTVGHDPAVADPIARADAIGRSAVTAVVDAGRRRGDWPAASDDADTSISMLGDGFLAHAAQNPAFSPLGHADALLAACERLLR